MIPRLFYKKCIILIKKTINVEKLHEINPEKLSNTKALFSTILIDLTSFRF